MVGFLSLRRLFRIALLSVGLPGLLASAQEGAVSSGSRLSAETGSESASNGEEADSSLTSNAVFRYLESVFGMPDDPAQARFIAYPVLGYAPETSWEFGVSGLLVYYAKDNPKIGSVRSRPLVLSRWNSNTASLSTMHCTPTRTNGSF